MSFTYLPLYLGLGSVIGFLAGLLGVGGGVVIVPVLVFAFAAQGFSESHLMHLAIGTSLASIMFTSVSSLWAHHGHGAVNWPIVKGIAPGVLVGTFLGASVAVHLPSHFLRVFFVGFLFYVATQTILNIKPKSTRSLPGPAGLFGAGSVIGAVSSWVGIGGGALSVPFMAWCNVGLHQAIGTSAAIGFPIAVAGALGYGLNGWGEPTLPPSSIGYIYLPALFGVTVASILVAPLGAKVAHRLPVAKLRKIFAIFLYLMGIKLLLDLL